MPSICLTDRLVSKRKRGSDQHNQDLRACFTFQRHRFDGRRAENTGRDKSGRLDGLPLGEEIPAVGRIPLTKPKDAYPKFSIHFLFLPYHFLK